MATIIRIDSAPMEQQRFHSGEIVIEDESIAGSNFRSAIHQASWTRSHLIDGFAVMDSISKGAAANPWQDAYLLNKRSSIRSTH